MSRSVNLIFEYDALIKRAVKIVSDAPYWCFIANQAYARLCVEKDMARLIWPEVETYYDSVTIKECSLEFPWEMLFWSEAELLKFKRAEKVKYEREQKEQREKAVAAIEANERETLRALQEKYGK